MILLTTTAQTTLYQHPDPDGRPVHRNLGRLVQPRHTSSIERTALAGIPWAADNDGFNGVDYGALDHMLDRLKGLPGCRFVAVPDVLRCTICHREVVQCPCARPRPVYGDAYRTAEEFEAWSSAVRRRGLPSALVLQDGIDRPAVLDWLDRTWWRIDAVFLGGSTDFKLSPLAAELLRYAKHERGKWVHIGRVNTRRRFDHFASLGCVDSIDGTKFARWRKTYLDEGLRWTLEPAQLGLTTAA